MIYNAPILQPKTPFLSSVAHRSVRQLGLLLAVALVAGLFAPPEADAQRRRPEKAKIELVADRTSYAPGSPVRLAAVMQIEDHWHTNSHEPTLEYLIPTTAEIQVPEGWPAMTITYPPGVMRKFAFVDQPISVYEGKVRLIAGVDLPANAAPGDYVLRADVRYQACDDNSCLPPVTSSAEVEVSVGAEGEPANLEYFMESMVVPRELYPVDPSGPPPSEPSDTRADGTLGENPIAEGAVAEDTVAEGTVVGDTAAEDTGAAAGWDLNQLGAMLLLGVLGGLILNAMPCVLPVLSLKVFGMVKSSGSRREVITASLATAAGILFSFWVLALAALVARGAGQAVGWGVQFQEPGFVAFLAVIVMLFSLNLWGLFEIPLPASLANRLAPDGPAQGIGGHFASGLFATLMATPCSAPFLGTAVTFGLTQPGGVILAVFTAIGLGMALPFLLLAIFPAAAGWLPKPGAWMDTLKGVMGFLLAATTVWLFFVLAGQLSAARVALIQLALLGLALFVWLRHKSALPSLRLTSSAGTLASIVVTIFLAATASANVTQECGPEAGGLIAWNTFDRAQAEALAEQGKTVFVDVTADWCLTCKWNEKTVIETQEIADAFARHEVVAMKADWTNYNEEIRVFLEDHGRSGIPFYLLYRPDAEPHAFGELLTKGGLLAVLEGR